MGGKGAKPPLGSIDPQGGARDARGGMQSLKTKKYAGNTQLTSPVA
jgi:hypothetical protein